MTRHAVPARQKLAHVMIKNRTLSGVHECTHLWEILHTASQQYRVSRHLRLLVKLGVYAARK